MPLKTNYVHGDVVTATELNSANTAINAAVVSGAALGTPTSGTLTNCTGLPVAGISTSSGSPGSTTYLRGDGTWATPPTFSTGKAIAMAIVFG